MKKYLISYGDSNYAMQKQFLMETAIVSLFFDHIQIFSPDDIGGEFLTEIYEPVKNRRGGGYWLWKPYFIKKVFDVLEDDDILFYCDAGCMINNLGKERFDEYIEILTSSVTGTIDFELPHKEFEYTKQEVFDYFNCPDEIVNSYQLMATVIQLRKCAHSTMLVDKWYNTAIENSFLFTDERAVPQHDGFIDHRHDQSVFSVIRKIYGANIIPDETYFLDFLRNGQKSPFWATRLKG